MFSDIFLSSFVERPGFSFCNTTSNSKVLKENYFVNSLVTLDSPVSSSVCCKNGVGNLLQNALDVPPNSIFCSVEKKPEETNPNDFDINGCDFSGIIF